MITSMSIQGLADNPSTDVLPTCSMPIIKSPTAHLISFFISSKEDGHVYCVCSIKNNDGVYALKNESNVMDLSTAFDKIPGFSLICN